MLAFTVGSVTTLLMKSNVDSKKRWVATRGSTTKPHPKNRIQNLARSSAEKTLYWPSQACALKSSSPVPVRMNIAVLKSRVPSVRTRSFSTDIENVLAPSSPHSRPTAPPVLSPASLERWQNYLRWLRQSRTADRETSPGCAVQKDS